jgi:hypothetical protein
MDRPDGTRCANCGTALVGLYCHACGQQHEPHVHSVGHFLAEATESLTHADSRLWRTILLLLGRPGFLSVEFFAGRRARYLPPIRLYLVLSVLFFVLASAFGGRGDGFSMTVQLGPRLGGATGAAASAADLAARQRECDDLRVDLPGGTWLQPRLRGACQRIVREGTGTLVTAFVQNLPRAMFLFLPLVAALLGLLYWRPRRHYVEHLLFLVHNHAAVFLSASLLLLTSRVLPSGNLLAVVALGYYAWYCYRALRSFYGQGRARTLLKFLAIAGIYLLLGGVMLAGTALYSAATL